jgi:hypothetical protein
MLEPPPTVTLALSGNVLHLSGSAPHAWIAEARLIARGIAGISQFDAQKLVDTDLQTLDSFNEVFNSYIFYYLDNRRDLWPGQEKEYLRFLNSVAAFAKVVDKVGGGYQIEIRGHVPEGTNSDLRLEESNRIAELFYTRLRRQHLDMKLFARRGMGDKQAVAAAKVSARKHEPYVSFSIIKK